MLVWVYTAACSQLEPSLVETFRAAEQGPIACPKGRSCVYSHFFELTYLGSPPPPPPQNKNAHDSHFFELIHLEA